MIHGFPELWYSYRHQLPARASAGYHGVAVDLRGFGESDVTSRKEDYSLLQHAEDVRELIALLGAREAVGHDWGANLAWAKSPPAYLGQTARTAARRFHAVRGRLAMWRGDCRSTRDFPRHRPRALVRRAQAAPPRSATAQAKQHASE